MKLASLSEGVRSLTSLRDLIISNCPELTSLPQSIQCLSSLRFLGIYLCQRLASLPNEIQHLALLSELKIYDCSNLTLLPRGMRNLSALQTLRIKGCPHLEKERGEDWPNIAHIPSIQILRKVDTDIETTHSYYRKQNGKVKNNYPRVYTDRFAVAGSTDKRKY
ncbi:hypothetical protein V6N13_072076 [Hibiscus sabdariffa]